MAYQIKRVTPQKGVILPRRLYLASDQVTILEDGDPACAYLLAPKGYTLSAKNAKRVGLDAYLKKTGKGAKPKANKRKAKVENKSS